MDDLKKFKPGQIVYRFEGDEPREWADSCESLEDAVASYCIIVDRKGKIWAVPVEPHEVTHQDYRDAVSVCGIGAEHGYSATPLEAVKVGMRFEMKYAEGSRLDAEALGRLAQRFGGVS